MLNLKQKHQQFIFWSLVILSIFFILGAGLFIFYQWVYTLEPSDVYENEMVREQVKKRVGQENEFLVELAPKFLGFGEPKTYLILFLNNTELRPGGGFIGSYATVKIEEGKIKLLALEGSGQLDQRSPESWKPKPPKKIAEYLKVDQWFFRDSNWSPDFKKSSKRTLKFYKKEGGVAAEDVDHVVGVTTDVLSNLLRVIGPIKVAGKTFNSGNVVEKLQYEVSYDFKNRGLDFSNRKQILDPFFKKVVKRVQTNLIQNYKKYLKLAKEMLKEKNVVVFSKDQKVQEKMEQKNYGGSVKLKPKGDFLMWVDANLAALKTDHAIERKLSYNIKPSKEYGFLAQAKMTYNHTGEFDWRTSHYQSFARVYTPKGSELISAVDGNKTIDSGKIETGSELNKKWFGKVMRVEPGSTKTVSFSYDLPEKIDKMIQQGSYELLTQKQIGTNQPKLTLKLDFAKKLTNAKPPERKENFGDTLYEYETDLGVDRNFNIKF